MIANITNDTSAPRAMATKTPASAKTPAEAKTTTPINVFSLSQSSNPVVHVFAASFGTNALQ